MATKVLVPRLGEGVDELTIVKWLKRAGEAVSELEPLLEVETDKVVTEIPSPATGTLLTVIVPENTPAAVGTVIAWIGAAGESVPVSSDPVSDEPVSRDSISEIADVVGTVGNAHIHAVEGRDTGTRDAVFLSPIVRKLAAEHHLDLSQVRGTGLNGRITKQDVLAHVEKRVPVSSASVSRNTGARDTLLPVTTIRRQIAERMQQSKQISPHVMTVMEADLSRVVAHRTLNKAAFAADGANLTFTAYFIAAIAAGLKAQPLVNSSWTEQGILIHSEVNVGMAASLGAEGLIVPVLHRADELSLLGIARAVNDLAARARAHKLRPEEVRDGTFTLTNHGVGGSLFAMPIINQPQCGILGVGALQKRAVVVSDANGNDAIAIRPMVYLSFVFDHRILDGTSADAFLLAVRTGLENWAAG